MLIYRVEHPYYAKGPYHTRYQSDKIYKVLADMAEKHSDEKHPNWYDDNLPSNSIGLKAGFSNRKQLLWWFKGYFKILHKCGFKIVIYEIDKGFVNSGHSRKQINFYYLYANKKEVLRIPEFLMQLKGVNF